MLILHKFSSNQSQNKANSYTSNNIMTKLKFALKNHNLQIIIDGQSTDWTGLKLFESIIQIKRYQNQLYPL